MFYVTLQSLKTTNNFKYIMKNVFYLDSVKIFGWMDWWMDGHKYVQDGQVAGLIEVQTFIYLKYQWMTKHECVMDE